MTKIEFMLTKPESTIMRFGLRNAKVDSTDARLKFRAAKVSLEGKQLGSKTFSTDHFRCHPVSILEFGVSGC